MIVPGQIVEGGALLVGDDGLTGAPGFEQDDAEAFAAAHVAKGKA